VFQLWSVFLDAFLSDLQRFFGVGWWIWEKRKMEMEMEWKGKEGILFWIIR